MRYVSDDLRFREGRGQGIGKDYKPWIKTREAHSIGTSANPRNWFNGRTVELLSQGEYYFWLLLMWNDEVADIREQFPLLPLKNTELLADYNNIKHPQFRGKNIVMTTDFLVTMDDGTTQAFALKPDQKSLNQRRTLDKLFLEEEYWKSLGVKSNIITKDTINPIYARNIEAVTKYYDPQYVFDKYSLLKHLIARKKIQLNMKDKPLNFAELIQAFGKELKNEY